MNPPTVTELEVRSSVVTGPDDVFGAFAPDGFVWHDGAVTFATRGIAQRVAAEAVADTLAALHHPDAPEGVTIRAVGSLPFLPEAAAEFVIPAETLTRLADGTWWRTTIGAADGAAHPTDTIATDPARFSVARASDPTEWATMVRAALGAIERDEITKVVLARAVDVIADAPFDPVAILRRLRMQNPLGYVFADATGPGVFLGASPELLVERRGSLITSRPMAGTIPVGASEEALHTLKHEHEHRVVVDAVVEGFTAAGVQIDTAAPSVVTLSTVAHLMTEVRGTATTDESALAIARRLSPTPAVGGTHRDAALAFLAEHEGFDRGRYGGAVGWVDANGDGTFAVALRCGLLDGAHARLYAGAGIVAGSEPESEWAETQAKLEPMLRALVRP